MKVLISGPEFHGYGDSITEGFSKSGIDATYFAWPGIYELDTISTLKYFKYLVNNSDSQISSRQDFKLQCNHSKIRQYNNAIIEEIRDNDYELFLSIRGDPIQSDTLKSLRKMNVTTGLWFYDSFERIPLGDSIINQYDLFYSFDKYECRKFSQKGINCKYLPMAYDHDCYSPLTLHDEPIDIVFVGTLFPERREILKTISKEYPELRIELIGNVWNYTNPIEKLQNMYFSYQSNTSYSQTHLSPEQVNRVYNMSKICLNIHRDVSSSSINPRTFEILGSNSFQLVDRNPAISDTFENNSDLVMYDDVYMLIDLIEYYLKRDSKRERISDIGHKFASNNHTFANRAQNIIKDVSKVKS